MSTTIPINQVEPELELRIRLAESVEEMRARFEGFVAQNPELNVEQEYIDNGVRHGWLIDPLEKRVHVYCADEQPVVFENPQSVSGGDVLKGFVLELARIF